MFVTVWIWMSSQAHILNTCSKSIRPILESSRNFRRWGHSKTQVIHHRWAFHGYAWHWFLFSSLLPGLLPGHTPTAMNWAAPLCPPHHGGLKLWNHVPKQIFHPLNWFSSGTVFLADAEVTNTLLYKSQSHMCIFFNAGSLILDKSHIYWNCDQTRG